MYRYHFLLMSNHQLLMELYPQSIKFYSLICKTYLIEFSYTTGRGVEGLMRLTVRLKNPEESFEPAVNIIPVPDSPGPKLDYSYKPVSDNR